MNFTQGFITPTNSLTLAPLYTTEYDTFVTPVNTPDTFITPVTLTTPVLVNTSPLLNTTVTNTTIIPNTPVIVSTEIMRIKKVIN